ncbi:MAG: radical SAM protein [Elusimicrobia bacterium]|nr:radical SAM protein [Elusimicrobiota bacterium]
MKCLKMSLELRKMHTTNVPNNVLLVITSKCNLRCKTCSYGYSKGVDIPIDVLDKIAQELKDAGTKNVYITGGEPFLHKDFWKVITLFADRGLNIRLSTNGTLLKNVKSEELNKVKSISISLDGLEQTHDNIRGIKGTFAKVVKGIKNIKKVFPEIPISVSVTVLYENISQLCELIKFCKKLGVTDIGFQPFVPYFSTKYQRKKMAEEIHSNIKEVIGIFAWLKNRKESFANVKEFYYLCQNFCKGEYDKLPSCHAGRGIFQINPDCTVAPCSGVESTGNIKKQKIVEIFNSNEYIKLLEKAKTRNCQKCLFYCFFYPE